MRARGGAVAVAPVVVREHEQRRLALRRHLGRLLERDQRLGGLLEGVVRLTLHEPGFLVVRIVREHRVGALHRLLELARVDRDLRELHRGFVVLRIEPHGLAQLPETLFRLAELEVRLGQLVVCVGVVGVDLEHVLVLDHRLGVLLFLLIVLAALEVLGDRLLIRATAE